MLFAGQKWGELFSRGYLSYLKGKDKAPKSPGRGPRCRQNLDPFFLDEDVEIPRDEGMK